MATSIRQIANAYRVERVAFDTAKDAFDANEDGRFEEGLREKLRGAFNACQASAKALAQLSAGNDDERGDQRTVSFDASVLAGH